MDNLIDLEKYRQSKDELKKLAEQARRQETLNVGDLSTFVIHYADMIEAQEVLFTEILKNIEILSENVSAMTGVFGKVVQQNLATQELCNLLKSKNLLTQQELNSVFKILKPIEIKEDM